jgi:hypothetical protein
MWILCREPAYDELGETGKKLTGLAAITAGVKAKIQADLKALGTTGGQSLQVLGGMVSQLGINMLQTGFAAFTSGKSIGQAMKQAAAVGIAAIAQLAAVEAVRNLAWGLHAAGLTFLPGFQSAGGGVPNFFASAAAWGSLAAGAGIAAAALSRSGSSAASGGALGNQLASNSEANRGTEVTRRFVERDGHGIPQGDVIIVAIESNEDVRIKNYERMTLQSYRQGGAQRQTLDAHVSGIPITAG